MAQLDENLSLAGVYASALFSLAVESGAVGSVRAELDGLIELSRSQPEFALFLESRGLSAERREAGLEKMLRGRVGDLLLNTLLVMNRHDRAGLLEPLRRQFVLEQERASNEVEGEAITAVELSAEQRGEIERLAGELSGKKALITFRVEPAILGGLVLRVADVRWDNSVRTRLSGAARALAERADRGFAEAAA